MESNNSKYQHSPDFDAAALLLLDHKTTFVSLSLSLPHSTSVSLAVCSALLSRLLAVCCLHLLTFYFFWLLCCFCYCGCCCCCCWFWLKPNLICYSWVGLFGFIGGRKSRAKAKATATVKAKAKALASKSKLQLFAAAAALLLFTGFSVELLFKYIYFVYQQNILYLFIWFDWKWEMLHIHICRNVYQVYGRKIFKLKYCVNTFTVIILLIQYIQQIQ